MSQIRNKMNTCPAIKATGEVCGKRCRENPRCGTHMLNLHNSGPHTVARNELSYTHRAAMRRFWENAEAQLNQEQDQIVRDRLEEDFNHQANLLKIQQNREMNLLVREQQDEIRETGIDPDAQARIRRNEEVRRRNEANRARWQERNDAVEQLHRLIAANDVQPNQGVGELARFANDNQNVHTTVAVQQTKTIVERLLKIQVPQEYRWNMKECSKTPGEIIANCKLTPRGGWQMISKYCQDESIYEMEKGIYGKVLDAVWQYVLKSPDKEDLYKVIKQEMEDNIGMCAQGNLTRLCNILAGYMEGIGAQESAAEVLGRKLPLLMEIENQNERVRAAYDLLLELNIPENQWLSWVEPLVETGTISLQSNASGKIVGFAITF